MLTVDYDRLGLGPATSCSTWAAAPAATPSRPSGAAPGWWPATWPSTELVKDAAACSRPWPRPARRRPTGMADVRQRRRHPPARSPTTPSTASSPARCSSTSPTTWPPLDELHPGAQAGRHAWPSPSRPGCPRRCAGRSPTSTTPRSSEGGHVRIYTEPELRHRCAAPGCARRRPPRPRPALALLVAQVRGRPHQRRPPAGAGAYHRLLVWDIDEGARRVTRGHRAGAQPGAGQEPRGLRHQAHRARGRPRLAPADRPVDGSPTSTDRPGDRRCHCLRSPAS